MRVLLVKPPFNSLSFVQHLMVCEPLEFEVLAANLDSHHDIHVLDMRVDSLTIADALNSYRPHIVGFNALSMDVSAVNRLSSEIKSLDPSCVICVGGEHASFRPQDFEPTIDFIFRYDSASTFRKLIQDLESFRATVRDGPPDHSKLPRIQENPAINDDINSLRLPRRDLTLRYLRRYTYGAARPVSLLQLTAGCAFRCTYCSIPARQRLFVKRRLESILADIEATPATDLLSIDANALQDVKWSEIVYDELARANLAKRLMISCRTDTVVEHPRLVPTLKRAGVSVIAFGIESLSDETLRTYNKRNTVSKNLQAVQIAQANGILVRGNFIIHQNFSRDDFRKLTAQIIESGIEFPTFQVLTPLPGTAFYEEMREHIITDNFDFFDLSHSVLPTRLPFDEFHAEFKRLFRDIYSPTRLLHLARRLPITTTLKSLAAIVRSQVQFSYTGHFRRLSHNTRHSVRPNDLIPRGITPHPLVSPQMEDLLLRDTSTPSSADLSTGVET